MLLDLGPAALCLPRRARKLESFGFLCFETHLENEEKQPCSLRCAGWEAGSPVGVLSWPRLTGLSFQVLDSVEIQLLEKVYSFGFRSFFFLEDFID